MRAKKSLGQHFLSPGVFIKHIVEAAELTQGSVVLEIGPGKGVLTKALLETGSMVTVVEKDDRLIPILEEKFANEITGGQLRIVHADILECDLHELGLSPHTYTLVANIPYYITGKILRAFFESALQPKKMVLLVQKEVAERIARSKKESILSISVKSYGTPRYIKTVPARYFSPAPRVDSAILAITDISRNSFKTLGEKWFFEVLHAGFAQKRKLLRGNLASVTAKESVAETFSLCEIPENARAEDIQLSGWVCIANALQKNKR